MGSLIDGKLIAKHINETTARRVMRLKKDAGVTTKLAVVLVGDDPPSETYVRNKGRAAKKVGMEFTLHRLTESQSTAQLVAEIENIQADDTVSGLIVQLPLPEHIDTNTILHAIRPELDVDCLTDMNLGKLVMQTNNILPPTPGAVFSILKYLEIDLVGKNVTIIGVGPLVGKPLAIMMMNERASVTTCNSKTKDMKKKCLSANIIVTGVGKKDIVRGDMVPEGAIVIDTGVSFEHNIMYGDVNVDEVIRKAAWVTPTPGGVGPITVAQLLLNTVICAEKLHNE